MSSHTVIHDVSLELRRRIHVALAETPNTNFGLSTVERDIILSPPPDPNAGPPMLSLYLYHIEPDAHLRNQRYLNTGSDSLRYPPLALQLHYLVTALADEEEHNHLVLGRVLQHFHDTPFLTELNGTPLDDSHGGNSPAVRITQETLTLEELSRVWMTLRSVYQLSLAYKVQVVAVDSAQAELEARRVRELHTVVGPRR